MNAYQYIAYSNPDAANDICKKYGYYQVSSIEELAATLQRIVAVEGESSLKDIFDLHPDREIILELYQPSPSLSQAQQPVVIQQPAPCATCTSNQQMLNATGGVGAVAAAQSGGLASQTNMIIVVSALLVSFAIMNMKK